MIVKIHEKIFHVINGIHGASYGAYHGMKKGFKLGKKASEAIEKNNPQLYNDSAAKIMVENILNNRFIEERPTLIKEIANLLMEHIK